MTRNMEITKLQQRFGAVPSQSGSGSGVRLLLLAIGAFATVMIAAVPAHATLDNAAVARGSYGDQLVQTDAAILELPVAPAIVSLDAVLSASLDVSGGADAQNADGGDTLTVTLTVTNTGNVTLRGVTPAEASVTSGGVSGAGSFAAASPEAADIAPGASQDFTLAYTLGAEDVYRAAGIDAGLVASLSARGTGPAGEVSTEAAPVSLAVAANPRLSIAKDAVIAKADGNRGADLEAGDLVTYTYTVTNTGNVAISDITIVDEHEGVTLSSAEVASADEGPYEETESTADPLGANADESGANGVWDVLGAGGAVTFTYRHTVTQAEFEAQ